MPILPLVIQIERTQERLADTCAFACSPVRIGRNPLSDLQLDESFVSPWHALIRFDGAHTTYLDLGCAHPTRIDGKPIARHVEMEVTETTDIRIGSLRLHVLRVSAPAELIGARRRRSAARPNEDEAGTPTRVPEDERSSTPPPSLSATGVVLRDRSPVSGELPIYEPAELPDDVDRLYRDYARAHAQLVAQLQRQLTAFAPGERIAQAESLLQRYPELPLRERLSLLGLEPRSSAVADLDESLRRLTGGLFPPPGPRAAHDRASVLERAIELLELFSCAFVELRTASAQLCEELALTPPHDDSPLHQTDDPRAVLAYLLSHDTTQHDKLGELARALASVAVHPMALASAVVEGARELLQTLSPAALSGDGRATGGSIVGKLLGGEQKELWLRYATAFHETLDADRFTRKLFGRAFARTFHAVTGGRRAPATRAPRPSAHP